MILVLPIFAVLILHPEYPLLPPGTSYHEKLFWLSMLIAAYPFAQIFGVPIIGEMADRWGRKKAFSFSLTIVIIGYFFSAISLYLHSLAALLFFRCLTGFASANRTICLAAFSDIFIDPNRRKRYFGALEAIEGVGFIIAILLGGLLSDRRLDEWFSPAIPFLAATCLGLFNIIIVLSMFKETREPAQAEPVHLAKGAKEIHSAMKKKPTIGISIIFFFIVLAWMTTLQFNSVYLIEEFHVPSKLVIVLIYITIGVCWVLGAWILNGFLLNRWKASTLLGLSLIGMLGSFICDYFMLHPYSYFFTIGLTAFFSSIAWPMALTWSSFTSTPKIHGKVQGINQGIGALAMTLGPLLIDYVIDLNIRFLHLFSSTSVLLGLITYLIVRKRAQKAMIPE